MGPRPAQRRRAPTALPPSGPEIASPLRPGAAVGRWRLTERLGVTAFAAIDADTGEAVVVKAASAEALAREVDVLEAVQHRNLVRLVGRAPGVVVTARIPGPSLASRLAQQGSLTWPFAASVLAPVAEALAALHAGGWVHGDVSPSNVVLGDGCPVLIDLGRARPIEVPGAASGTPGSVAPEVEAGRVGGPEADVWSLAAVAAEAVTGAPCTASNVLPPGAPLALRRALAADPAVRPTAAELAAALRAAALALPNSSVNVPLSDTLTLEFGGGEAARITRDYGPRRPAPAIVATRARRSPAAVAALLAVVAVVAVAFVVRRPEREPTVPTVPACAAVAPGGLVGDPDGDGCDVAGHWAGGVLTIAVDPGGRPRRYALGAEGDVVALGDWDCDGDDTPGLYRPATGVVTLFEAWPATSTGAAPSVVTTGSGLPDSGCRAGDR